MHACMFVCIHIDAYRIPMHVPRTVCLIAERFAEVEGLPEGDKGEVGVCGVLLFGALFGGRLLGLGFYP